MTASSPDPSKLDLLPLLEIVKRRYLALLALLCLGLSAAFIFSKLVTPLYESHVIMYPSNSNSREKQLEDFSFGHEVQAERLMQLLNSNTMLDSLEAKFQLSRQYGIDKQRPDWYDQLLDMAKQRIQFHKNKYVSITISVIDEDPELCAVIANEAARLVNVINADIVKSAARSSLEVVEKEYQKRLQSVSTLGDSITGLEGLKTRETENKLRSQLQIHQARMQVLADSLDQIRRRYNIYDFGYQVNVLNEKLASARADFLENSGKLDVYALSSAQDDSLVRRYKAQQAGAKLRADSFLQELNQLNMVNKRYTSMQNQLEVETEISRKIGMQLQEQETMLNPNLESRHLNHLEDSYRWDQLQTQELYARYQRALGNYLEPVPAAIIVSEGKASYKRVYPHTMVNLALGGLSALLFGILLFAFLDRRKVGAGA